MTERFDLLSDALGLERGEMVAFTGGGGKTSAILTIAHELAMRGWRVVASTTTRVGPRVAEAMPSFVFRGDVPSDELLHVMERHGRAFVSAGMGEEGKYLGVDPWTLDSLKELGVADVFLVEADGARHLPIKAPGEHEPRVPSRSDLVVPMVGLDSLGLPIDEGHVHRPELLRNVAGGRVVTAAVIAAVLTGESCGLKGTPDGARVVPVLNKADAVETDDVARVAAGVLSGAPGRVDRVVVASIRDSRFAVVSR